MQHMQRQVSRRSVAEHVRSITAFACVAICHCEVFLMGLQGIVDGDPMLAEHAEHLKYRFAQYQRTRDAIEAAEGSLANFAKVGLTSQGPPFGIDSRHRTVLLVRWRRS